MTTGEPCDAKKLPYEITDKIALYVFFALIFGMI
jgi:hypothetical protein